MSKGIIGQVAKTQEILNIPDAYEVPNFNAEADAESGYRTKSILCMPVITVEGHMVAVIEMINKLEENMSGNLISFSSLDEDILAKFVSVIAGALSNSLVYNELEQVRAALVLCKMVSKNSETIPNALLLAFVAHDYGRVDTSGYHQLHNYSGQEWEAQVLKPQHRGALRLQRERDEKQLVHELDQGR